MSRDSRNRPCTDPSGFLFLNVSDTKKSGGFQPILNLEGLKPYVIPEKFRMETLASVKLALGGSKPHRSKLGNPGDPLIKVPGPWVVSFDLKDCYFHVAIHPDHTEFLRFAYWGVVYEFVVLRFGLQTALRIIWALGSYLRKLDVYMYLDESLVTGKTYEQAIRNRDLTYRWTVDLDFLVNDEKSE